MIGRDTRIELIVPSFEAGIALFETEALAEPQRDRVAVLPEEQRNIASSKAIAGKSKRDELDSSSNLIERWVAFPESDSRPPLTDRGLIWS